MTSTSKTHPVRIIAVKELRPSSPLRAGRREPSRLEPLMADYDERLAEQQRLVAAWRFVSPTVLANEAFVELAGSGIDRQRTPFSRSPGPCTGSADSR